MNASDIRFINRQTKSVLRPSKKWRVFCDTFFDIFLNDIKIWYVELADNPTGWDETTLGVMKIEILPEYRRQGLASLSLRRLMELTCPDYVYAEITNTLSYGLFCSVFGAPIDTDFATDSGQLSKTPGFIGKKYTVDMIFENIC